MRNTTIHKIEIIPIEIKLTEPFVISKGALTHARNTVIKIYNTDGQYGVGECCPYRSIHGETQTGTVAFAKDLAAALIGSNPREIHKHVALMDRMIAGNASVKCAFDMALYDLVSKMDGLPLYAFLQGDRDKKIFTDNTVSLLPKDKMVEKALKFKEMGFPVLKVKLGERSSSKDVDRMIAIRNAVGEDLPLRVDANQGWNYIEAHRALQAMKDLHIEHCEEPVQAGNIVDQIRLTATSPIPIMADETVFNHKDAYKVLSQHAAHMINIKLGKSGGICNSMKVAAIAQAADVYCQTGSFSESRLGISALVHFDMVWDNIIFHDLDSPLMLSEDPVIGGMTYHKDWQVTVDDTPGHGADFDPNFLKRFDVLVVK
ncbi:MAG: dipeptide epimerase [Saprospiraceae bacterium]|nr:dipeptide epimerase [Saprospiraceae bacterium]